jgi:thymidylate synthase (FAD)
MDTETKVLDHGYVKLIERGCWGDDAIIIESARMSTSGSFRGWDQDHKLLRYLWEHKHYSPFEFGGITVEVQAPIFVFREWHRHRTQSYNELSARYTELPDLFYAPSIERLMAGKQSSKNKQGSEEGIPEQEASYLQFVIQSTQEKCRIEYENLLRLGVSRELARLVIPVSQYSRMRASANLRNWLAFVSLRQVEGAQWEIRQYANVVGEIIKQRFPRTWELFIEEQNGNPEK